MSEYDVISLDLFSTLIYIDRTTFAPYSVMEKALLKSKGFEKKIQPYIPLENMIESYTQKVRIEMLNHQKEEEFQNAVIIQEICQENGINISPDIEKISHQIMQIYFDSVLYMMKPFRKLHETLDYLKEKYSLVLTSNHSYPKNGWDIIQKYNIEKYFEKIVFSGDIGWKKPSSKIFSYALSNYKDKEKIVHVGDDLDVDIYGALNYGIKALWIKHSKYNSMDNSSVGPLVGIITEISEIARII